VHSASGLLVSLAVSEGMAGQVPGSSTEHGRGGQVLTYASISKAPDMICGRTLS
jgi:hypothetical protein